MKWPYASVCTTWAALPAEDWYMMEARGTGLSLGPITTPVSTLVPFFSVLANTVRVATRAVVSSVVKIIKNDTKRFIEGAPGPDNFSVMCRDAVRRAGARLCLGKTCAEGQVAAWCENGVAVPRKKLCHGIWRARSACW